MFNIGGGELLVILLVGLIVLGPQKLPEAARQVGRIMTELRKISTGFQDELREAFDEPVEAEARARGQRSTSSHARAAENARKAAAAAAELDAGVDTDLGPGAESGARRSAEANVDSESAESSTDPEHPELESPAAAAGMYDVAGQSDGSESATGVAGSEGRAEDATPVEGSVATEGDA